MESAVDDGHASATSTLLPSSSSSASSSSPAAAAAALVASSFSAADHFTVVEQLLHLEVTSLSMAQTHAAAVSASGQLYDLSAFKPLTLFCIKKKRYMKTNAIATSIHNDLHDV
jgi:hypothetical protein